MRKRGIGTEIIRQATREAKLRGRHHVTGFATVNELKQTFIENGFSGQTLTKATLTQNFCSKIKFKAFLVAKSVNYEAAFGAAHYNGSLKSPECFFMVKEIQPL